MTFKKGQSGNVKGKPVGTKCGFTLADLMKAVRDVEKEQKVSLLKHFVERSLLSDKVLVVLIRKFLPDMIYQVSKEDYEELMKEELEFANVPDGGNGGFEKFKRFYG